MASGARVGDPVLRLADVAGDISELDLKTQARELIAWINADHRHTYSKRVDMKSFRYRTLRFGSKFGGCIDRFAKGLMLSLVRPRRTKGIEWKPTDHDVAKVD